jgi:hypothetical protein
LRGSNFACWGPLAPGEEWSAPNPGAVTPQGYTSASTSFAGFRPDVRTVDGAGFAAPNVEQMKTAFFVPALPSPAFLNARLDAARPMLQVGSTRVLPSVPGVTFGDAPPADPPSDSMTNPPSDPPPPVADAGAIPPPDGVYPVPAAASVAVDVAVPINPSAPGSSTYSRRPPGSGSSTGSQPTQSNNPPANTTGTSGSKPPRPPQTPPVVTTDPKPVSHPIPDPVQGHPVTSPATKIGAASTERDLYRQVLQDIDPAAPDFTRALRDLDAWSHQFPNSSSSNDRLYYYVHVYNQMSRPDQVLNTAAPLVATGVRAGYRDQQQVLQILVAASASLAKVPRPTAQQLATGQSAARELLEFLPEYFSPRRKPSGVSDSAWSIAKGQLEDVARQALAHRPVSRAAAAN